MYKVNSYLYTNVDLDLVYLSVFFLQRITDKPFLGEILAKLYFEKVIPIVIGVGKTDEEGLRVS